MCKRQRYAAAVLAIHMLLLSASSALAQKVTVDAEKSANLSHFKRYAWSKNYLMTSLRAEDVSHVEAVLNDSINRQMQAKGYVLDESNPDFRIFYDAGGQVRGGVGVRPDMTYTGPTMLYTAPMDVWANAVALLQISIVDAASNAPVWRATASEKVNDREKFMRELNKNIDKITANTLKKFPAAAKATTGS